MSGVTFLGAPLFARAPDGRLISRVLTIFPRYNTIVTQLPPIHALQIEAFIDAQNAQRLANGLTPLSRTEERDARDNAVCAVIEGDCVLLRPDPDDMPTSFHADQLLQAEGISKRRITYLNVFNKTVRGDLKRRGETWRIARLPTGHEEMMDRILAAKTGLQGRAIYYYNATTGTRWLTCQEFGGLGELDDTHLQQHLQEIREFSARPNRHGVPEVAFYMADETFTSATLAPYDFSQLSGAALRTAWEELKQRFAAATAVGFERDDLENDSWRYRMFSSLITVAEETVPDEVLLGLSPEFFMQIQWSPGGHIENGELVFDEVFEEEGVSAREERARELLFNLMREYDDLEYVNIGIVLNSLSRRAFSPGRREVFLAVVKRQGQPHETVRVIRMQKWGVGEHLNDNRDLPLAMFRSDEYTEYVLDRRFAGQYLGMNIPKQFSTRKICERYFAAWTAPTGYMIWSPYFDRAYIAGIATDKMPRERFQDAKFALAFATLLGKAAASNLIVGRCDAKHKTLFDDGDEIVVTDDNDLPVDIVLADQTGTFGDFYTPLHELAPAYADPVNRRVEWLTDPEAFARAYLEAFVARFTFIQEKFRRARKAFTTLFQVRPHDNRGSFADRWQRVLARLDEADASALAAVIRAHLTRPPNS